MILLACGSIAVWNQSGIAAVSLLAAACFVVVWVMTTGESYEEHKARILLEETFQTTPGLRIERILSGMARRRLLGAVFLIGLGLILYAVIRRIVVAVFVGH